ncbi:MAG TPA: hypothetical protein PKX07_17940 [Aggregatilineales bacterium]|nr:hypothetical protein [Aggregatilineales bacterium]
MTDGQVEAAPRARRGPLRRLGCGIALVIWFVILLFPGFLLLLAIQQEVVVWHGRGFPEAESHPLVQVKLIMDARTRGVSITSSHISIEDSQNACVQTNVNYLLWQGTGEAASYCDCYARAGESGWTLTETYSGACRAGGS